MKKAFCILAAVFFCLCMTEGEARAAAETVEGEPSGGASGVCVRGALGGD